MQQFCVKFPNLRKRKILFISSLFEDKLMHGDESETSTTKFGFLLNILQKMLTHHTFDSDSECTTQNRQLRPDCKISRALFPFWTVYFSVPPAQQRQNTLRIILQNVVASSFQITEVKHLWAWLAIHCYSPACSHRKNWPTRWDSPSLPQSWGVPSQEGFVSGALHSL